MVEGSEGLLGGAGVVRVSIGFLKGIYRVEGFRIVVALN